MRTMHTLSTIAHFLFLHLPFLQQHLLLSPVFLWCSFFSYPACFGWVRFSINSFWKTSQTCGSPCDGLGQEHTGVFVDTLQPYALRLHAFRCIDVSTTFKVYVLKARNRGSHTIVLRFNRLVREEPHAGHLSTFTYRGFSDGRRHYD